MEYSRFMVITKGWMADWSQITNVSNLFRGKGIQLLEWFSKWGLQLHFRGNTTILGAAIRHLALDATILAWNTQTVIFFPGSKFH